MHVHQTDIPLSVLGLCFLHFLINYTQKLKNEQDAAEQATHILLFPTWTFLCVMAQKSSIFLVVQNFGSFVLWVFWNKELPSTSQDGHLFVISKVEVGDAAGHFRTCHIPSYWAFIWFSQRPHETDSHSAHCSDVKGHTVQGPQLPQVPLEHAFSRKLWNHMQRAMGIAVPHLCDTDNLSSSHSHAEHWDPPSYTRSKPLVLWEVRAKAVYGFFPCF